MANEFHIQSTLRTVGGRGVTALFRVGPLQARPESHHGDYSELILSAGCLTANRRLRPVATASSWSSAPLC